MGKIELIDEIESAINLKCCPKCKRKLPKTEFGKKKKYEDGLNIYCKGCQNKMDRERYKNKEKYKGDPYSNPSCKKCPECDELLERTEFQRDNSEEDGLFRICRKCRSKIIKENYNNKEKYKGNPYSDQSLKQCSKCKQRLERIKFCINRTEQDGLDDLCKDCKNEKQRESYTNKEKYEGNPYLNTSLKKCPYCKKELERYNFHKHNRNIDGLENICKRCRRNLDVGRMLTEEEHQAYESRSYYNSKFKEGLIKIIAKTCADCKIIRYLRDFDDLLGGYFGTISLCKKCDSIRKNESKKLHPETRKREKSTRKGYGYHPLNKCVLPYGEHHHHPCIPGYMADVIHMPYFLHDSSFISHTRKNIEDENFIRVNAIAYDYWFNEKFYLKLYLEGEEPEELFLKHKKLISIDKY